MIPPLPPPEPMNAVLCPTSPITTSSAAGRPRAPAAPDHYPDTAAQGGCGIEVQALDHYQCLQLAGLAALAWTITKTLLSWQ